MLKYKDTYKVIKQKDKLGNYSNNKEDSYIYCRNGIQIFRYNSDTLCVQFLSNKRANNKIKELSDTGVQLTVFQRGDDEQTYIFKESDLNKVADVVYAKKRIKRNLTDEQREVLKERLARLRKIDR